MPEIGEIVKGKEIGKDYYHSYMWVRCSDCGECRWVMIERGKPSGILCHPCVNKRNEKHYTIITKAPLPNEIRHAKQIGTAGSDRYKWTPCIDCGKYHWVALRFGEPRSLRCMNCRPSKDDHWKYRVSSGGKRKGTHGYILVKLYPDDKFYPMVGDNGYVQEHRLVMAKFLKRCLKDEETVHHINKIRSDNRIENLLLFENDHQHQAYHHLMRKLQKA